ncbi:MAG: DMT family transporter [Bacteroidota bacterium]
MNRSGLAWGLFIGLVLVWGSSFMLMKIALQSFEAIQIGAMRLLFAAAAVLVISRKHFGEFRRADFWPLLVVALMGNSLPYILFPIAVAHVPSGVVGVANAMTPVFALLVGVLAFGRTLRRIQVWGVALGLLGAVLLISPWRAVVPGQEIDPTYLLLAILAAGFYGVSINTIGSKLGHLSPRGITLFVMLLTVPMSLGILGVTEVWNTVRMEHFGAALAALAFLGIVGTGIATVLFNRLIALTTPLMAASTTYLIPVVALAWGVGMGETILAHHFGGMAAIVLGVYLVNKKA